MGSTVPSLGKGVSEGREVIGETTGMRRFCFVEEGWWRV
jgi:hypothetical protein